MPRGPGSASCDRRGAVHLGLATVLVAAGVGLAGVPGTARAGAVGDRGAAAQAHLLPRDQRAPGVCGSVLLRGSQWLGGKGVDVYSNGSDEGRSTACDPGSSELLRSGLWDVELPRGSEWQATELLNRLYLARHWTDERWRGAGGDRSPGSRSSMYYRAPNGLGLLRQREGAITYLAPGDAVFVNEYVRGRFRPGGDVLLVDTTGRVTSGHVPLVSQDSGTLQVAIPLRAIEPVLHNGELVFRFPKGSPYRYRTIGVVHAPIALPLLTGVRQLASNTATSCALLDAGTVDCWGGNVLGTAIGADAAIPVPVAATTGTGALTSVVRLVAGETGYCALLRDRTVDCWGFDRSGELGTGRVVGYTTTPAAVVATSGAGALTGVVSLHSDGLGYCAILVTSTVDCWGYGRNGQLGDGIFYTSGSEGSSVPVPVVSTSGTGTLSHVVELDSDGGGYCALLGSGTVDCWGFGLVGDLGDGLFYQHEDQGAAVPVRVVSPSGSGTLGGVVSLATYPSAYGTYCAVLSTGSVDCWGNGGGGQLGNGTDGSTDGDTASPVAVVSTAGTGELTAVRTVTDLDGTWCALLTSGTVDCWGDASSGALGDGMPAPGSGSADVPVRVVATNGVGPLTGVAALTGGPGTGCALLRDRTVDCWGSSYDGELGDGTLSTSGGASSVPVAVVSPRGTGRLAGVVSLSSSLGVECALLRNATVDCWGSGQSGELGDGTFFTSAVGGRAGSPTPVPVRR